MNAQRTILIAGPTASGKSALALMLAKRLGGVVINADSAQVYRELRVLTARPSAAEEATVPHRLYGHAEGAEAYSAARFVTEAATAIGEAHEAGLAAIVVGGTGLYFKALLEGLSPVPPVPVEIREHWRRRVLEEGPARLHAELVRRDPETASRLRATDPQRLARALEVLDATGRGLASWQAEPGRPAIDSANAVRLVVAPAREAVLAAADRRLEAMLAGGAVEEVRALVRLGLSPQLPVMRALGVVPLTRMLAGEIGLEEAAERTRFGTRQYVKRQLTWIRRHMITWNHINSQQMEAIMSGNLSLIDY